MNMDEIIEEHIKELDKGISKTYCAIPSEYSAYASLMQAKTDFLIALLYARQK